MSQEGQKEGMPRPSPQDSRTPGNTRSVGKTSHSALHQHQPVFGGSKLRPAVSTLLKFQAWTLSVQRSHTNCA